MPDPRPEATTLDADAEQEVEREDAAGAERLSTLRWWLNLQIALALAGGAVWFAGVRWEQEFLAGLGCGLIVAALLLRLGRAASQEE